MPEELWAEVHDIVQEAVTRPSSRKRKAKWLSDEALHISEKRREPKGKGEKERYTHLNAEFQRIERKHMKAFPSHFWAYTPRKPELKETHVPQCSSQHCLQ